MKELWKDIAGYGDKYRVSSTGRVMVTKQWDVNKRDYVDCSRLMRPTNNGHGYMIVGLRDRGKRKNQYVHRLVANAFIDNPKGHKYVNHIDFNTRNNTIENLEWCSQKQNIVHSVENMKKPHNNKLPRSTGERYIRIKKNRYEVTVRGKYIGCTKSLREAILMRERAVNT